MTVPGSAFSDARDALAGIRIVTIALNLPGPVAVSRLRDFGASVVKVEPPTGDPLALASRAWYGELHDGIRVERLDLKGEAGRAACDAHLAEADLFIASQRPSALARLGLDWSALHARFPRLSMIEIVGEFAPHDERSGHDLTYVAAFGLVDPPKMPRTLIADLAGAERASAAAIALTFAASRDGRGRHCQVALADAARAFAEPIRHRLTTPGGWLGGGVGRYNVAATADGWLAVGALEPHFYERLRVELGLAPGEEPGPDAFRSRTTEEWVAWGQTSDVPLAMIAVL
jgi:crotonobetainyl-CoA:carnitine CoA-transferase CaiB-like acyl-CoA transferase